LTVVLPSSSKLWKIADVTTIGEHLRRPGVHGALRSVLDGIFEAIVSVDAILRAEVDLTRSTVPDLDVVDLDAVAEFELRLVALAGKLDTIEGLDRIEMYCADIVRTEIWQRTVGLPQSETLRRVPYWYLEHLGDAYEQALHAGMHDDQTLLSRRIRVTPRFLAEAAGNLDWSLIPVSFLEPTVRTGAGLSSLVDGFAQLDGARAGGSERDRALGVFQPSAHEFASANEAITGFVQLCSERIQGAGGQVDWRLGSERFDEMLVRRYRIDTSAAELFEEGKRLIGEHQKVLRKLSTGDTKGRSWTEILDDARHDIPSAEGLLDAYRDEVSMARRHVCAAGVVTLPAGERCTVGSVPEYRRHGLPMGVMEVVSPFGPDLESVLLISPVDLTADDGGAGHLAESNRSFLRSIVGHETYPGHHVQGVHHKLALAGVPACALHRNPSFVEGWGFYTEDILQSVGFFNTLELLVTKERNGLWRAARLVVDSGIHSHRLSPVEAVSLLERECVMSEHMATGEIRRYVRHDNATYPSAYVLGANRFRALRAWWERGTPAEAGLSTFHDLLLSAGSPPIGLITEELIGALELMRSTDTAYQPISRRVEPIKPELEA